MEALGKVEPRLQVVSHDGNHGRRAALVTGFRAAPKGIVVTMDTDLSHQPLRCRRRNGGVPWFRVMISQEANGLMRVLFGTRVLDLTGLRTYGTDVVALDRIEAKRFDAQRDIYST